MSTVSVKPAPKPGRASARPAPAAPWFTLQHRIAPYLFVAPFVLLFLTFGLWPIVKSLILAFYATNGPKSNVFVGVSNFRFLFADQAFHTAALNTAVYAFWSVFLQLPLALGLALLLNRPWLRGARLPAAGLLLAQPARARSLSASCFRSCSSRSSG